MQHQVLKEPSVLAGPQHLVAVTGKKLASMQGQHDIRIWGRADTGMESWEALSESLHATSTLPNVVTPRCLAALFQASGS